MSKLRSKIGKALMRHCVRAFLISLMGNIPIIAVWKMCTFAHVYRVFFGENKETIKEAELPTRNSASSLT
jgi:hypothetical protein